MNLNLLDLLILVSLLQGVLLGILLLSGRLFKSAINKFLAFFILALSVIGLDDWLSSRDYDEKYYFIDFFGDDIPWILICYVFVFVYFLKSVRHPLSNSRKLWWLTVPFFVFLFINIIIDLDTDFGWIELEWVDRYMYPFFILEYYLAMAYSTVLCGMAHWIIEKSLVDESIKRWLKQIWLATLLLVITWIITNAVSEWSSGNYAYYGVFLGVSFFLYWLTYKGLYQFQLVQDQAAVQHLLKKQARVDTAKPSTNNTLETNYLMKLGDLMEQEHLYRNPDLNRELVAERLGISVGYLSQVVNAKGQNFTTLINKYRVQAVQQMLQDRAFDQYSLLAIGMEAGFKSKSAFYNTFKQVAGMTPNEYKKRILKS